ncbi:DUF5018 domain-containing protein [Natronoflexus pectinivorans]|uniref:DUF5018 domain-containing protein n=1 Tax=Natronoflexus pectinivorans TaxID=682526 RepID=A0A4R2G898_9BACT|nr:hypothetical protein [Natronoflexus pectinivorans]TCO04058.1 hypothetical protein EV194_11948 [Natronoflexus pectinivorans]
MKKFTSYIFLMLVLSYTSFAQNGANEPEPFYINFNSNPAEFPFDFTEGNVTVTVNGVRSSSTSDPICGFDESNTVITRRNQTNFLELELNGISMAEFHVSGASSGTAPRTIHTVYLWNEATSDWDDISGDKSGIYSTFTDPTTSTTCHTTGITGLALPDGSKIRVEFNSSIESEGSIQNVRVSELKIIPMEGDPGNGNGGDDVEPFYMNWNSNPSAFPYDYTVGDITVSIDPVSGSTSTSAPLCGFDESDVVIERRLQTNTLILELNGISMAEFHVAGGSSGATSTRTIHSVFLLDDQDNETLISNPDNIYSTIDGGDCGLTGVTGLSVADGSRVKILFNTTISSNVDNPQNVRVGEMKIIPMADDAPPVLSDAKEILSASVADMLSSVVESTTKEVNIVLPQGADLSSIAPEFTLSEGASISPDDAQDFSQGPVVYTVTAEDGSTAEWTVSITIVVLSDAKEILTASVTDMVSSVVETSTNEVTIVLPQGADLSSIAPGFTLSEGASISPEDAQDFSGGSVVYTVTAEDGSTAEWTVSITLEDGSSIPVHKNAAVWYVSNNSLHLSNISAGSIVQQIALSGSVVSEGVAHGNSYVSPLVSGVQIIRIISNNYVEVIKVTGK